MAKSNDDHRFQYLAYEIIDPRPGYYFRYVGYGRAPRPWRNLKGDRRSAVRRWLNELHDLGLRPFPIWDGLVPLPVTQIHARYLASFRREQLRRSDECKLLDNRYKGRTPAEFQRRQRRRSRKITAVSPDGTITKFPSIREAARQLNMSLVIVQRRADKAKRFGEYRDHNGITWRIG